MLTPFALFLTFLALPTYLLRFGIFGIPTNTLEIIIIATIIIWLIENRHHLFKYRPDIIDMGVGLIFLGATGGLFVSLDLHSALGIWKGWVVIPILLFWIIRHFLQNHPPEKNRILESLFLAAGGIGAALSLWGIHELLTCSEETPDGRLASVFENPNQLALLIVPLLAYHLFSLIQYFSKKTSRPRSMIISQFLIIIILSSALALTRSYGGLLALIGATVIALLFLDISRRARLLIIGTIIIAFSGLIVLESDTAKFSQALDFQNRSSTTVRLEIWQVAIGLVKEYPLFGIGPGQFERNYGVQAENILGRKPIEWNHPQPHNIFLAFWLQTGLLGLLGFLTIIIVCLKIIWRNRPNTLSVPLLAALLVVLIHGLIDTPFWKNDLAILFWLIIAGISSLKKSSQK